MSSEDNSGYTFKATSRPVLSRWSLEISSTEAAIGQLHLLQFQVVHCGPTVGVAVGVGGGLNCMQLNSVEFN